MITERVFRGVVAGVLSLVMSQFVYFPVFANGPVEISIIEAVMDGGSESYQEWEDITGVMPGEVYSAIPRVRNDGEMAATVKMCIAESAEDSEGNAVPLSERVFEIEINNNWTLDKGNSMGGDCYNYNRELGVGEITEPLFTEVTLSGGIGNRYQNDVFHLHLTAEATGGYPNSDEKTEKEAGVKEEENDEKGAPGSPDTGEITAREAFLRNTGTVFLAAGILVVAMRAIRQKVGARKNRRK